MTGRLEKRVAIVVGAGSSGPGWGNGKCTAVTFAREGAKVFCVDRKRAAAEETVGLIAKEGGEAAAFLRAANESLAFAYNDDPSASAHMRDLGQLLSRFSSQDPAITAAQQAVDAALSAAVLLHIEGAAFAGARGISVYIPTSIEYFATAYNDSPTAASWSAVLDTVYNAGADAVGAIDSAFVIPPEGLFDSTGVSVHDPARLRVSA